MGITPARLGRALRLAAWGCVGWLALAAAACSSTASVASSSCGKDADCAARGAGLVCSAGACVAAVADAGGDVDAAPVDPRWACLGSVAWSPPDPGKPVHFRNRYLRFFGEAPVDGMEVRACRREDDCAAPVATGTTDPNGYVDMDLPRSFDGFLSLYPPASFPTMIPAMQWILPPPEKDDLKGAEISNLLSVHVTSVGEINLFMNSVGVAADPARGHILGLSTDCQGNPAKGVSITLSNKDDKTVAYYTDSVGSPSAALTETQEKGEGGFGNVAPGTVTVEARVAGRKLGAYTVLVKAGTVTYLPLVATP